MKYIICLFFLIIILFFKIQKKEKFTDRLFTDYLQSLNENKKKTYFKNTDYRKSFTL